jgi:hypothetical protein
MVVVLVVSAPLVETVVQVEVEAQALLHRFLLVLELLDKVTMVVLVFIQ